MTKLPCCRSTRRGLKILGGSCGCPLINPGSVSKAGNPGCAQVRVPSERSLGKFVLKKRCNFGLCHSPWTASRRAHTGSVPLAETSLLGTGRRTLTGYKCVTRALP